jgi:PQQ-like domain
MKNLSNNHKMPAIIIITLLIASVIVLAMPSVKAQEGVHGGSPIIPVTGGPLPAGVIPSATITTIPYISFSPNPIGIGQTLLVNLWVQPATVVNRAHTGYTVTITKPDGTTDTAGPMVSYQGDTTAWFEYVPGQVGTYTLQFSFAGDYYPVGYYVNGVINNTATTGGYNSTQSVYYASSQTAKYTLTVQQDQVASWPASPLPTDYWSRPISPENREWWVIGGNCPYNEVGGGTGTLGWPDNTNVYSSNYKFTPYVQAPNTAHIAWRRQGSLGGIFGGLIDGAYTTAQAPDTDPSGNIVTFGTSGPGNDGNPNIVFEGRCYQAVTKPYNGVTQIVWECYDIQTGQIYWDLTNITRIPTLISFAENAPPVPGGLGRTDRTTVSLVYIGSSNVAGTGLVVKYNPMTGAVTSNVTIPVTSGTLYADPYVLSVQTLGSGATTQYRLLNWTLQGISSTFAATLMSNISYPFSSIGTADYESMIAVSTTSTISSATGVATDNRIRAASLTTGQLLWNISAGVDFPLFSGSTAVADHGKFAIRFDDAHYYCWDLYSGKQVWVSEVSSNPWGTFGDYSVQSAYGLIFANQYDGVVAYNWTNGKIVWMFQAPALPFETPYTNGTGNLNGTVYSWFSDGIVADGKLYTYTQEHSPTAPLARGWKLFAINATTGVGLWNITGPMGPGVVSDGYLTAGNYYDGFLYVFGKGLSSTTVTAPSSAITTGQNVVISGTVLDQSPAQPGTPCVSADSMGDWMAYLHMQHAIPSNVIGVPVSIDTVDPNGNPVHIATVTSDMSGTFGYTWAPAIPGQYKITATFVGDDSYGSSWAQTYATVTQAPAATPTPTATTTSQAPTYTTLDLGIITAVIIAILIGLVNLMLLRKK